MGDLPGSDSRVRTSEDKVCGKDMCWSVRTIYVLESCQGFTSADPLEKVDIGDGTIPRPTFVNKNLSAEYKADLVNLLKEYVDCFAWEFMKCLV